MTDAAGQTAGEDGQRGRRQDVVLRWRSGNVRLYMIVNSSIIKHYIVARKYIDIWNAVKQFWAASRLARPVYWIFPYYVYWLLAAKGWITYTQFHALLRKYTENKTELGLYIVTS